MSRKFLLFPCLLAMVLVAACSRKTQTAVVNLRCEFLHEPLGIDITRPRLSWEITAPGRGVMQTAYQVLVASSPEKLKKNEADLWNSGRISSDSSVNVRYAGAPLRSRADCYWKVKVWLSNKDSALSSAAHWSMGLLDSTDWSAKWTGLDTSFAWESPMAMRTRLSARYFRKDFNVPKKVKKAVVYISGLGIYQLYIDGRKIGNEELSP